MHTRHRPFMFTIILAMTSALLSPVAHAQTTAPAAQAAAAAPTVPSCAELATALNAVVRNDARLRDWPNLARYRDANLRRTPAGRRARVVFMGDSITDSWQQPRSTASSRASTNVDRGISGQTTPQMLLRFRRDVIALRRRPSSSSPG